jgi:hypothetical protein
MAWPARLFLRHGFKSINRTTGDFGRSGEALLAPDEGEQIGAPRKTENAMISRLNPP